IAALFQRRLHWRRRLNALGLCASTAYLLITAAICLHVRSTFAHALTEQGIAYERLHVVPTPFNAVLWSGLASEDDHLWAGLYSLLDDDSAIRFRRIERNTHLISSRRDDPPIQRLFWFSRGYYRVEHRDDALYFYDLRFGRSDFYLDSTGTYFFTFRLSHPERIADLQRINNPFDAQRTDLALKRLWLRLLGN
ncbi:MAG: metal-dependent hydrolase, partial [Candidatus Latescibacteria bacterium]|nr:metal-dependent hydrolase [Candidatus Latescibacterota bacterium]